MLPPLPVKVLLVDDDEDDYLITRDLLQESQPSQFDLEWVTGFAEAQAAMRERRHDVYLVDYRLGHRDGLDLLREAVGQECHAPVIMLTGQGDHATDVEAMKAGAADFLVKGQITAGMLERSIRYALEKARTMEHLRHSEERYRALFESNPQPMWAYDRESLAILTVNDAAIRHYGYTREEFLAMTIKDLHPVESHPALLEAVKQVAGSLRKPGTWKQTKKNGERIDVEITTHDLTLEGHAARLVLAIDVTERLNLEAQLRQALKMESVGQLAAGVAHDFNNILTVIQGQVCLLLVNDNLSKEAAESLTQILVAAERAANLTRQLLTFSRRQIMQRKQLTLNAVIRNVAQMLHRLLGENIGLELNLAASLPCLHADEGMMEQMIVNLSVNSRDAMPKGGRLTITTAVADIDPQYVRSNSEARAGRFICLSVADTGCGMDAATLSRIFEPFFTTKEVGKGTGLGLATIYGIVKQHQGWVEVQSQLDCGTTFKVFLPANTTPPGNSAHPREPLAARGRSEPVLVVEDEPHVRRLVQQILHNYGYQVFTAATGAEALDVWRRQQRRIQLLLTDMVMPGGLSGRELAATLQAEQPELRVIYTSGYSVDLVGRDFHLREGYNFLQKPYHPNRLVQTVRNCLDHDHHAAALLLNGEPQTAHEISNRREVAGSPNPPNP